MKYVPINGFYLIYSHGRLVGKKPVLSQKEKSEIKARATNRIQVNKNV